MPKRTGIFLMGAGCCMLLAALLLTLWNLHEEQMADRASEQILAQMEALHAAENEASVAGGEAATDSMDGSGELVIPDYVLNPDIPMPELTIDGNAYIGTLELPRLGLKLPVMSDWSYPKLKKSPCRYLGSAYKSNLIIAGHNYKRHFNGLKRMQLGDAVYFTDEADNVFSYEVVQIERLNGYAVEEMESGDWDLTLFTCTAGGSVRLTLRCRLLEG